MSDDLISRQALCDDLREYKVYPVPISSDESEVKGYNDGIDLAISVISEFPSAEPERKKGKWKDRAVYYRTKGENQTAKCSVCEQYLTTPYLYRYFEDYNFCPYCGADMRGDR